jgi:four helix bundle protein
MSIVANIAEGYGRHSPKDFAHFISISLGSINEVKAFLDIIQTIYQIDITAQKNFYTSLGKQTWTFRKSLLTDN